MALDKDIEKELLKEIGVQATEATKAEIAKAENRINEKAEEFRKGLMTEKSFEDFKKEALDPINKTLEKLETASKEQGTKMTAIIEKAAPNSKSMEQFVSDLAPQIKDLRSKGGFTEFSGAQLKAAGVNSIAGSIPTPSPYAPGIGGPELQIFDIVRNPNFITSKIDLGRTDKALMAWANEIDYQGLPAIVAEGALKPQTQHLFSVETSRAKKIASWIEITDEFDQDLPQFGTLVRRMLQMDVERAWDDAIQIDVQAAANPFNITALNGSIKNANYWDALLSEMGQVGFYNFVPNAVAINWLTNVKLNSGFKASTGEYLLPPFAPEINAMKAYANKMAVDYGLVGDLKQYKVDIYKDFYIKVGWINDELINNKFCIVGEIRYHSYISSARKKAIVYDSLITIDGLINTP